MIRIGSELIPIRYFHQGKDAITKLCIFIILYNINLTDFAVTVIQND